MGNNACRSAVERGVLYASLTFDNYNFAGYSEMTHIVALVSSHQHDAVPATSAKVLHHEPSGNFYLPVKNR